MAKYFKTIRELVLSLVSGFRKGTLNTDERAFLACLILLANAIGLQATLKLFDLEYIGGYLPRWLAYFTVLSVSMVFMDVLNYFDSKKEEEYSLEELEKEDLNTRLLLEAMERDANGYREKNEYIPELHDSEFQEKERLFSTLFQEAIQIDSQRFTEIDDAYFEKYIRVHSPNERNPNLEIARDKKREVKLKESDKLPLKSFSPTEKSRYYFVGFDLDNYRLSKIFSAPKDLDNFVEFLVNGKLPFSDKIDVTSYPGTRRRNVKTVFGLLHYCLGDYLKDVSGLELEKFLTDICQHFTNNGNALTYKSVYSHFSKWRGYSFQETPDTERKKIVQENATIAQILVNKPSRDKKLL